MNARKKISLEELFRLYPQLQRTTHQEDAHAQGGQGNRDQGMNEASARQAGAHAEA
jgi:hypothetical protein